MIQTYTPHHPAIQYATHHDYTRFFQREMKERAQFRYPPFSRAVRILISSYQEKDVEVEARRVVKTLNHALSGVNSKSTIEVIGPAPAIIPRLKETYRWQILLQSPEPGKIQSLLRRLQMTNSKSHFAGNGRIQVDVDPVGMV